MLLFFIKQLFLKMRIEQANSAQDIYFENFVFQKQLLHETYNIFDFKKSPIKKVKKRLFFRETKSLSLLCFCLMSLRAYWLKIPS